MQVFPNFNLKRNYMQKTSCHAIRIVKLIEKSVSLTKLFFKCYNSDSAVKISVIS